MANNVILNLRGGGGSGKTTTFRQLLESCGGVHQLGPNLHTKAGKDEIKGYTIDASKFGIEVPIFMMGSYEAKCGGTDKVKKQQEIADRAIEWHKKGYHVLFEGLLVSKLGPKGTVTRALVDHCEERSWFLFLDTPAELCLERVLQRRKERGDHRPFDPNVSLFRDHKYTWKCKDNLEAAGILNTGWVNHKNSFNEVVAMIKWAEKVYG